MILDGKIPEPLVMIVGIIVFIVVCGLLIAVGVEKLMEFMEEENEKEKQR
jgi:hypothetical protein